MKNKKVITVEVDISKPVLDLLIFSVNDFLTSLMDDIPDTYYIDVTVGNNHPEIVTIPISKIFTGGGERIDISPSFKNKKT
jgi:hypothetical protein